MKKIVLAFIFVSLHLILFAQTDHSNELKTLYESNDYDKILNEFSDKVNELSAKSVYYVGMAYYMKQADAKCIEMMDLSIKKDHTDPDAYFIKGMTLNYLSQFDNAITAFKSAIKINSRSSDYYSGLGDAYVSINDFDKALNAYQESSKKENPIDRPFTMIPQIYSAQDKPEEALKSFYTAKENISKKGDSYITVLYNIGLLELLNDEYDKAQLALEELIKLYPEDYPSYSKIIQIHYAKKEYAKAIPYKKALYRAYENGVLKEQLSEMFCFDQFEWKDKLIQAFEKFEEKEGELYYKHLFYIVNKENEIEFRIQTENSPISIELGGAKYLVGMDKDGEHFTFNYSFDEEIDYDKLKETVLKILNDDIAPAASSRKN